MLEYNEILDMYMVNRDEDPVIDIAYKQSFTTRNPEKHRMRMFRNIWDSLVPSIE